MTDIDVTPVYVKASELTEAHIGKFVSYRHPRPKYSDMTPSGTVESVGPPAPNGKIPLTTRHADGWKTIHFLPPDHPVRLYRP